jgi:hypothetical protein
MLNKLRDGVVLIILCALGLRLAVALIQPILGFLIVLAVLAAIGVLVLGRR